jgi:hypothetical protein
MDIALLKQMNDKINGFPVFNRGRSTLLTKTDSDSQEESQSSFSQPSRIIVDHRDSGSMNSPPPPAGASANERQDKALATSS